MKFFVYGWISGESLGNLSKASSFYKFLCIGCRANAFLFCYPVSSNLMYFDMTTGNYIAGPVITILGMESLLKFWNTCYWRGRGVFWNQVISNCFCDINILYISVISIFYIYLWYQCIIYILIPQKHLPIYLFTLQGHVKLYLSKNKIKRKLSEKQSKS